MKRQKYATVCGIEFQGDTCASAKATGEIEIARLAREANSGPSVYRVREMTVLVFPQLNGWGYRILLDTDKGGLVHPMCNMGGTRAQCIASAVAHAAMWQWSIDDADNTDATHLIDHNYLVSCFWPAREKACPELATVLDRIASDCKANMGTSRRYRALAKRGYSDAVAHDVACRTRTIEEAIAKAA